MKTIIVSGKASGVGKTTLITKIIKKLANLTNKIAVIKCSINDEFVEPEVIDDIDVINTPGTDTAFFNKAGSNKTVFIKSNQEKLQEALKKAQQLIDNVNYLFVEGNSPLNYMQADLTIYITDEKSEIKASAVNAKEKSDIIINSEEIFEKEDISNLSFKLNLDLIKCAKAMLIANVLDLKPVFVGKELNKQKVKLSGCQLGCF